MKKTAIASALHADLKSLKDCAYRAALGGETISLSAQYAIDNIAGFPDECSDEARAELDAGWKLRFNDLNPAKEYMVGGERKTIGIDYAMSFSTYEFGKLGETQGAELKGIVKEWRDRLSTYCSNRYNDLTRSAKKLLNKGEKKRGATLAFGEWITEKDKGWLETADTRCRNASKRGDPTADVVRFRMARDAFLKVWAS